MNNKIKEFQGEYRWLSNFWPVKIEYKGRIFSNVENVFHSEKSDDEKFKDFCANEPDLKVVKKLNLKWLSWEKIEKGLKKK